MLDGPDGIAIVGIVVVNQLAARGPVRKKVAVGSQLACNGSGKDVEDDDGQSEASDGGDCNLG